MSAPRREARLARIAGIQSREVDKARDARREAARAVEHLRDRSIEAHEARREAAASVGVAHVILAGELAAAMHHVDSLRSAAAAAEARLASAEEALAHADARLRAERTDLKKLEIVTAKATAARTAEEGRRQRKADDAVAARRGRAP